MLLSKSAQSLWFFELCRPTRSSDEQSLTSHSTHCRSFRGRVFPCRQSIALVLTTKQLPNNTQKQNNWPYELWLKPGFHYPSWRVHGTCWRVMETGHPSTRVVETGLNEQAVAHHSPVKNLISVNRFIRLVNYYDKNSSNTTNLIFNFYRASAYCCWRAILI